MLSLTYKVEQECILHPTYQKQNRTQHALHAFSRSQRQLHVFLLLTRVSCFSAAAKRQLQVFFSPGTSCMFSALGTCCKFSRAWHQLQVFPRLAPAACFPAPGTTCMAPRWHHVHVIASRFDWFIALFASHCGVGSTKGVLFVTTRFQSIAILGI